METVAIAGATGKMGRTLVEVLSNNTNRKIIALSRTALERKPQVASYAVDFKDTPRLQTILQANNVHTVISAMQVATRESAESEINLVRAASASPCTKRFVASEWAMPVPDKSIQLPFAAHRASVIEELSKTHLEYTTVNNGMIADHLGTPHLDSHMGVYAMHMDVANRAASIPGTGDDPIAFTYSYDLAKFVGAMLALEKWETKMYCYSDRRTYNQVLAAAEEARGCKFAVVYDGVEKLKSGGMTDLPSHVGLQTKEALQARWARFGLYATMGLLHVPHEKSMNAVFPEVKTMTIEEIVGAWKGKD